MGIKHVFVSPRADSDDAGAVQPSHWNAEHELTGNLAELDALVAGANLIIYFNGSSQIVTAAFSPAAQNFVAQTTTTNLRAAIGAAASDSPTLTGTPIAPTAAQGTNTNQIATMAAIQNEIAALVGGAPAALNTLKELADAINDDANYSATITASLGNRLRIDVNNQGLTGTQQQNGRTNLGLGTASTQNVGTSANNVVQLDGSGKLPAIDGSQLTNTSAVLRGHFGGLTLSTAGSSATFSVSAGQATDSTNVNLMTLAAAINKTTGAWAVGTGNGALDASTIANNTWYQVHLIKRTDTGVVDVLISLSATAPTLPTNYTLFRRIGSMKTNGSGQWMKFFQVGDTFMWSDMPALDYSANNPGTAAVTVTMNGVPTGVRVEAIMNTSLRNAGTAIAVAWLLSSLDVADVAPNTTASPLGSVIENSTATLSVGSQSRIWTNASAQIRSKLSASDANVTAYIQVVGWRDLRGIYD